MPAEPKPDLQPEIAHVLFIDIVGYSKLLVDEQTELLQQLNELVRATDQFRSGEANEHLIRLPTGDGMALVFFSKPDAPVQSALEISKALKNYPDLHLRMGIHSGPVNLVRDVNERSNVAGAGINMAQRVMDCGDAGHILLSKRAADDLAQYRYWQPHLHDLGEFEVKHGVRMHVVNLYTDELGNPQLPAKLRGRKQRRLAAVAAGRASPARRRGALIIAFVLSAVVLLIGFWTFYRRPAAKSTGTAVVTVPSATIPEKSIAVLPFQNLSEDKANAYFADGIQEEILTRLAKIADLKVISRTSTQQYQSRPGNLSEIAKQLSVANILEGSVQKVGDQVRVNVQLINAKTDSHVWAEMYDRKLTDIFAVESEIAKAIAESLQAKLSGTEQQALAVRPTNNSDAYVLYLKAREREGGVDAGMEDRIAAEQLYTQAIALDPTFALAHARASMRNSRIFGANSDEARKAKARMQAEEALRLSPTLSEAHFALGLYLWLCERDFVPALKELSIAEKTSPNNAEIFWNSASIYRNQGRWRESLMTSERALNLDPRNAQLALYAAYDLCFVRDWQAGTAGFNRVLEIAPDSVFARVFLAYLEVIRNGNVAAAKAILGKIPAEINPEGGVTDAKWDLSMLERDLASAEKILDGFPRDEEDKEYFQGRTALARGDAGLAQRFFEMARPSFEAKVRDHPDDALRRRDLGLFYAYVGRKEDAIRESRTAVELAPESKEPLRRAQLECALAMVYARTGEADQAITLIERLLSTPGAVNLGAPWSMTLADLRLRWEWDPLRTDPRFQKILAGPEPKTIY